MKVESRVSPEPSTLSDQLAQASVYDPVDASRVRLDAPERVTTGEVVSGRARTLTVRVVDPVLLFVSVYWYVRR